MNEIGAVAADSVQKSTLATTLVEPVKPHGNALAALCMVARFHQVAAAPQTLAHQLGLAPGDAVNASMLLRTAKHLGLKAKFSWVSAEGMLENRGIGFVMWATRQSCLHDSRGRFIHNNIKSEVAMALG